MFTKAQILDAIQRSAKANGGVVPGTRRLETETGIRESDWSGRYWARWSDALREAGFAPNEAKVRRSDHDLLSKLADLSRRFGRVPTRAEMRMATSEGFPAAVIGRRYPDRASLVAALSEFCAGTDGYADVLSLMPTHAVANKRESDVEVVGYVYLIKSGRHYKIGRSNAVGRRERELQIQLPERAAEAHRIATDDPVGIERYWHERFRDRRGNGEWFDLTAGDIRAFRRRKIM